RLYICVSICSPPPQPPVMTTARRPRDATRVATAVNAGRSLPCPSGGCRHVADAAKRYDLDRCARLFKPPAKMMDMNGNRIEGGVLVNSIELIEQHAPLDHTPCAAQQRFK